MFHIFHFAVQYNKKGLLIFFHKKKLLLSQRMDWLLVRIRKCIILIVIIESFWLQPRRKYLEQSIYAWASAFGSFLTVITKVLFLEGRLDTSLCLHPNLRFYYLNLNPLSANFTKWSNTLKQFVGNLPTNCFSVFDHFVGLVLKGLSLSGTCEATIIYHFLFRFNFGESNLY